MPPENDISIEDFENVYKNLGDDNVVVDVREKVQYDIVRLPNCIHLPIKKIEKDDSELKKLCAEKKKVYLICRRGNQSRVANDILLK